jgi:CRP-like cAMP-binding protein
MTVKSLNVTRRLVNYIITEFEEGKSIWTKDSEKNTSNSFTLNIAKIDLASYLGATLETISRTFKKLQDKKLIKLKGRNITILNLNGLKKLL